MLYTKSRCRSRGEAGWCIGVNVASDHVGRANRVVKGSLIMAGGLPRIRMVSILDVGSALFF